MNRRSSFLLAVGWLAFAVAAGGAPITGTAEYRQAQSSLAQGNFEAAVGALQPLLADSDSVAGAQLEIGRIRAKQAEGEYSQAMAHFHDAAQALSQGLDSGRVPPSEEARTLFELSRMYDERLGDLTKAMACYERLLANHPSFLAIDKVLFHQAAALEKMGRGGEAAVLYQKLCSDHPYSSYQPVAQERLKTVAPGTAVAAAAIETQQQAVEEAPSDEAALQAQMDLAHMHRDNGDYKDAVAAYRKVAHNGQNPELARKAMGELATLLDEKRKDYKGAAEVLEDMIKRFPTEDETAGSMLKLGRLYEENLKTRQKYVRDGRVMYRDSTESSEKAVGIYDQLTQSRPDADESADAYLRKADIYETKLADPEKARAEYERFLRYFPGHAEAAKVREKLQKLGED